MPSLSAEGLIDPEFAGALIEAAGSPAFAPMMLDAAGRHGGVDEIFAFRATLDGSPEALLHSSGLANQAHRTSAYALRFHRFDPAARARDRVAVGQSFVEHIRADQIVSADYRAVCFDAPRFLDKVCFGWRGPTYFFVMSFYRRRDSGEDAVRQLSLLAGLGLTALVRRHKAPDERGDIVARIEARMSNLYPQLSLRERQICARTLAGWTAAQIAHRLSIRPSTVPTYRQRAYVKLGFSNTADFLDTLLD